jgi:hypothetical protein
MERTMKWLEASTLPNDHPIYKGGAIISLGRTGKNSTGSSPAQNAAANSRAATPVPSAPESPGERSAER